MKLYGMQESGNCWKAATILTLTGHDFEWVRTDGNAGETRTPEFLTLNPIGKVPAVELDDATILIESNAILLHFAEGTEWLPAPGLDRTRVHEWLFFEQYSHEPYIAVARNLITWQRQANLFQERLEQCARKGADALDVMERRLAGHEWLVGATPTIADLALFAYTHRADEGRFDLARWPGVLAWIDRIAAIPGMTTLPRPDGWAASTTPDRTGEAHA
jgi:glutathione S-transferase